MRTACSLLCANRQATGDLHALTAASSLCKQTEDRLLETQLSIICFAFIPIVSKQHTPVFNFYSNSCCLLFCHWENNIL